MTSSLAPAQALRPPPLPRTWPTDLQFQPKKNRCFIKYYNLMPLRESPIQTKHIFLHHFPHPKTTQQMHDKTLSFQALMMPCWIFSAVRWARRICSSVAAAVSEAWLREHQSKWMEIYSCMSVDILSTSNYNL